MYRDVRFRGAPQPPASISSSPFRAWDRSVFFSDDRQTALVFASVHLGAHTDAAPVNANLWLIHLKESGWRHGSWQAGGTDTLTGTDARSLDASARFEINTHRSLSGDHDNVCEALSLEVRRNGVLSPSRSVDLSGGHFAKWQAECDLFASGQIVLDESGTVRPFTGRGHRALMRGKWDLDQAPGWIALAVDSASFKGKDRWGMAFLLAQPGDAPADHECAVVLWRNGRLVKMFSRRHLRVFATDTLDQGDVDVVPFFVTLLPPPTTAPVPRELRIEGKDEDGTIAITFVAHHGARVILPSETGNIPGISHQIYGEVAVSLGIGGRRATFRAETIAEYGGGIDRGPP